MAKTATYTLSEKKQIMHYSLSATHPASKRLEIPTEIFSTSKEIYIRTDLESVGVDICDKEVRFSSYRCCAFCRLIWNWLWNSSSIGRSALYRELRLANDKTGLRKRCATIRHLRQDHRLCNHRRRQVKTARLGNLRNRHAYIRFCLVRFTYCSYWFHKLIDTNQISSNIYSKAILARKSYPFVPDEAVPASNSRFESRREQVYLGPQVRLARCDLIVHWCDHYLPVLVLMRLTVAVVPTEAAHCHLLCWERTPTSPPILPSTHQVWQRMSKLEADVALSTPICLTM